MTIKRRERKLWASAETLEDLGDLMAMWLEGDLRSRPGYYGKTDLDTAELTELCAALCRAGVVTVQSGPGMQWHDDLAGFGRSRICVEAFTDEGGLTGLRTACDGTDLMVVAHRTPARRLLGRTDGPDIPLVQWDYRTVGTLCHPIDRSYVGTMWDGISREAFAVVVDGWQVAVIDPQWGRSELLLAVLGEWARNAARTAGAA